MNEIPDLDPKIKERLVQEGTAVEEAADQQALLVQIVLFKFNCVIESFRHRMKTTKTYDRSYGFDYTGRREFCFANKYLCPIAKAVTRAKSLTDVSKEFLS